MKRPYVSPVGECCGRRFYTWEGWNEHQKGRRMSAPEPILVIAARAAMTCTCGHYRNMHFRANSFCMAEVVDDNEERDACSCDYFTSIVKAVHADE